MNSLNYPKVAHCQVLGEQLCRASSGSRLKALAMFTMLSLFVATLQAVNIDAGMDTVICKGQSHTLGGNPTASGGVAPYSYEWTSDPAGFTSSDSTPVVSPTQKTT